MTWLVSQLIRFDDVEYPYKIGWCCAHSIVSEILALDSDLLLVVTDDYCGIRYAAELMTVLSSRSRLSHLIMRCGEAGKTLSTLSDMCEQALGAGATRRSIVVAIGGGAVGNLAGLLAAGLFRGIRLVHIPTTLVAAFDSVLSLKQAVNLSGVKNLFGTYYQPSCVLIDGSIFAQLRPQDIRSGLIESVKNALAICPDQLERVMNLERDWHCHPESVCGVAQMSITAKQQVLAQDKWEKRRGLILEYGHTVGHAIELSQHDPLLTHGECVGVGMIAAAHVASDLGFMAADDLTVHYSAITHVGGSTTLPTQLGVEEVMARIRFDNKRGYLPANHDDVDMILLSGLGKPASAESLPLLSVPEDTLRRALRILASTKAKVTYI